MQTTNLYKDNIQNTYNNVNDNSNKLRGSSNDTHSLSKAKIRHTHKIRDMQKDNSNKEDMQDRDTKCHDKVNLISHKMNENQLNNEGYRLENPTN